MVFKYLWIESLNSILFTFILVGQFCRRTAVITEAERLNFRNTILIVTRASGNDSSFLFFNQQRDALKYNRQNWTDNGTALLERFG